jgi:hypothetical protein
VIPDDERPQNTQTDVYFSVPQARLLIARVSGFETWDALARYHQKT